MSSRAHACPRAPSSHDSRHFLSLSLFFSLFLRVFSRRRALAILGLCEQSFSAIGEKYGPVWRTSSRSAIKVPKFVRERSLGDSEELSLSLSLSLVLRDRRAARFKDAWISALLDRPFATASPRRRERTSRAHRDARKKPLARITRRRDCIHACGSAQETRAVMSRGRCLMLGSHERIGLSSCHAASERGRIII